MSECVVRMEMPESCYDCPMEYDGFACSVTGTHFWRDSDGNVIDKGIDPSRERQNDCPIVCSLPEGHGRLVDADALNSILEHRVREGFTIFTVRDTVKASLRQYSPTIVPAERSEHERTDLQRSGA